MTASHLPGSPALPASVRLVDGRGQLPRLDVSTPRATAQVYLHGGHVASWRPSHTGDDVLWISEHSLFQADKPIRGGVPVCFPWFGAHPSDSTAPAHGFARLADWTLARAEELADGGVRLELALSDVTSPAWPHRYRLTHRVTIGTELTMALETHNAGREPFTFEEALHTYLRVGAVNGIAVTGLGGTDYLDKVAGMARRTQVDDAIHFEGETDRLYLDTAATCIVADSGLRRRMVVSKSGSASTVVWNPWIAKARTMPDFGDDEWRGMVCVETANAGPAAVTLEPGETHLMTATIVVEPDSAASAPRAAR